MLCTQNSMKLYLKIISPASKQSRLVATLKCILDLPADLLKLIFEAPSIELIKFSDFYLEKEDCIWLRDLVEGRFQNLEEVCFFNMRMEHGCTTEDLGLMVKWLVCGAPKLKEFNVNFDSTLNPRASELWLLQQPCADKLIDLIYEK